MDSLDDGEQEAKKYISFIPVPKRYQNIETKVGGNTIVNKEGDNIVDVK